MATTYEAIRDRQIVLLEQLTPTSIANVGFKVNRAEVEFRGWADADDVAAFRRFAISELREEQEPEVSDEAVEWIDGTQEVLIAYDLGTGSRYGKENRRDMADVIRQDEGKIRKAIGSYGRGNYTMDVATPWVESETDEQVTTVILSMIFRVAFYGTVPATEWSAMQNSSEQSFQYTTTSATDSYTITIPAAMIDTSYIAQAELVHLPSGGQPEVRCENTGRTKTQFTLSLSGTVPTDTIFDIYVRDRV